VPLEHNPVGQNYLGGNSPRGSPVAHW
jgi:hypothetical protein